MPCIDGDKPERGADMNAIRHVDVAIAGAGFGGLCMAIKLKQAGIQNFVILEKGSEVGGTWRDNQYPGAACDVQSHMYSYSFETSAKWTKRYAPWQEIQQYILDVTAKYGLRPHIRFGQEVTSAVFNEGGGTLGYQNSLGRYRDGATLGLGLWALACAGHSKDQRIGPVPGQGHALGPVGPQL